MSQPKPSSRDKVRAHRERMRAKGLRQVTRWVIDTRSPEWREAIARECRALAEAESRPGDARDAAEWVYTQADAMFRELDEIAPYDWGPLGPPK